MSQRTNDHAFITAAQANWLRQLCRWNGINRQEICALAGVRNFNRIPMARASELIDAIANKDGELKRQLAQIRGQLPLSM